MKSNCLLEVLWKITPALGLLKKLKRGAKHSRPKYKRQVLAPKRKRKCDKFSIFIALGFPNLSITQRKSYYSPRWVSLYSFASARTPSSPTNSDSKSPSSSPTPSSPLSLFWSKCPVYFYFAQNRARLPIIKAACEVLLSRSSDSSRRP